MPIEIFLLTNQALKLNGSRTHLHPSQVLVLSTVPRRKVPLGHRAGAAHASSSRNSGASSPNHWTLLVFCPILSEFLKFIYSEEATKFCEISTLLLSYVVPVKSKVEISQNFVAITEYLNFNFEFCL